MDEIAAEGGVSKPVLYRHFGDKAGLCLAILDDAVADIVGSLRQAFLEETDPVRRIARAIDAYLSYLESDPRVFELLKLPINVEETIGAGWSQSFVRKVGDALAALSMPDFSAIGMNAAEVEARSHGIVGMVYAASDWWIERKPISREHLVNLLTDLVYLGFRSALAMEAPRDSISPRSGASSARRDDPRLHTEAL
jgi:AcrR family transcriptional regulator